MAKNKEAGDDRRAGAVKSRSQIKNAITGTRFVQAFAPMLGVQPCGPLFLLR
jgi:hypothetical protein